MGRRSDRHEKFAQGVVRLSTVRFEVSAVAQELGLTRQAMYNLITRGCQSRQRRSEIVRYYKKRVKEAQNILRRLEQLEQDAACIESERSTDR